MSQSRPIGTLSRKINAGMIRYDSSGTEHPRSRQDIHQQ